MLFNRHWLLANVVNGLFATAQKSFTSTSAATGALSFAHREIALYLHFPYCDALCRYCPFSRTLAESDRDAYLSAVIQEITTLYGQGLLADSSLSSLAFGGGTPSLIPPETLRKITSTLRSIFPTYDTIQKTMECTADSLTEERLALFSSVGFNRLTVGVQSLRQPVLDELGRPGTPEEIREKLSLLKSHWAGEWSCDMIYGFSTHTLAEFLEDVQELVDFGAGHISLFPLVNTNRKNRQQLTKEEFTKLSTMYGAVSKLLLSQGFFASSVEDFSRRPEAESHYQKDVWGSPQKDLLIIGSGAFGLAGGVQYRKSRHRGTYMDDVSRGIFSVDRYQPLTPKEERQARFIMGAHYHTLKGLSPWKLWVCRLLGLATGTKQEARLTPQGAFVASLLWAKIMVQRLYS